MISTLAGSGGSLITLSLAGSRGTITTDDGKGTELVSITSTSTKNGEGAIATFKRAGGVKNQWP